jgi:2-methylisocitrate lyase-like PEP mutase family enzyme
MSAGRDLRRLCAEGQVSCLGAFDAISAKLAQRAGGAAIYISGFAASAVRLGMPDLGLMTQTEMAEHVAVICRSAKLPVIADGDTGYGGVHNVQRTVQLWEEAGAAAVHLEDQIFPKRCGHIAGKELIPMIEAQRKIAAACDARRDKDFMIIARTDAVAVSGLDDALARCRAYAKTGADVLFVDAPESREQLKRIGQELGPLGLPLLFNAARTLKSPIVPADELKALGFGIIIYPIEGLLTMMKAVEEAYRALLREGSTDAILPMAHTFRDINEMLDMPAFYEREQGYTDSIAA